MNKIIDLNKFIDLYYNFISEKGWTKLKYKLKYQIDDLLGSSVTSISVKKNQNIIIVHMQILLQL